MSRPQFDNYFEVDRFITAINAAGHSARIIEATKTGRYTVETPWSGPKYTKFMQNFKKQKILRQLSPKYLEQEQELL